MQDFDELKAIENSETGELGDFGEEDVIEEQSED